MVLVDANVLVAVANASDSLHERAVAAVLSAEKPMYVPEYVAVETAARSLMSIRCSLSTRLSQRRFVQRVDQHDRASVESPHLSDK